MKLTVEGRSFDITNFSPEAIQEAAAMLSQDKTLLFGMVNAVIEPRDHPHAQALRNAIYAHIYALGNSSWDAMVGIRNVIANSPILLRSPSIRDMPKLSVPAISIGAAPSLPSHLARLRELQHSCLLVCSDTILGGLVEQGIHPHVITPLERTPDMPDRLPVDPGDCTFAGTAVFDPRGLARFKSHILVSDCSGMAAWIGTKGIAYGSSTGTMSVAVALELTDGPVYLVGHDLSFPADQDSHWTPATAIRANAEQVRDRAKIMGNNGQILDTTNLFRMYATDFSLMALCYPRIHNVNAFNKIGAVIPGTIASDLPQPGPTFTWVPPEKIGDVRYGPFHERLSELRAGIDTAINRVQEAKCVDVLTADGLGIASFAPMLEVIMRAQWCQFSFERHLGATDAVILPAIKDAMTRILQDLRNELKGSWEGNRDAA